MTAVTQPPGRPPETAAAASPGALRRMFVRFRRDRVAVTGLVLIGLLVIVALLAPWIAPDDPDAIVGGVNESPSAQHLLGTDDIGRDLLSRVMFGARVSIRASFQIVALAVGAALPLGLVAGYAGGRRGALIMRLMDGLFAFPPLILALTVASLLGPSLNNATFAIAIVFVPSLVRLVRGQVLAVREETYIEASRAVGIGPVRMLTRHVLPNAAAPLIVQGALTLGFALLAEAGLSFLGFGEQPPTASWGVMLRRSFDFVFAEPWQIFVPGGAIMVAVLGFNLVGDGLRDSLGRDRSGRGSPASRTVTATASARVEGPRTPEPAMPTTDPAAALEVRGLGVELAGPDGWLRVVDDLSLNLAPGEVLGLVGESGCGKTVSSLALMGLLSQHASRLEGSVRLAGRELLGLPPRALRAVQGHEIAMVFQEPSAALNPAFTIGDQIGEVVRVHRGWDRRRSRQHAVEMLERVGIPSPAERARSYPHEFSGGMQQRAMIAMALASEPHVLVADEPTTALDVTVQAEILDLLRGLQREMEMAVLFVTHDLAVVAEICDRVAVMYAGQIVETASVGDLFERPRHPYTEALLGALPQGVPAGEELRVVPGEVPIPGAMPSGCRFHPRCPYARDACVAAPVRLDRLGSGRTSRCVRTNELELEGVR